ncbi:MAG: hydrolase TatD [Desulfobacteraceae bacterium 4572_88]|nr:MAG: hydrolase TatD [Desulfobacteraceae bacterium 4572_88]RLC04542.1 MAG: TatD family deoxyribonuclease [Deltaproteobacteria bacterium]
MRLFDSHCHLDDRSYDKDRDEVMARMNEAGIISAMIVGINKKSSHKAVRLAEASSGHYASVGVHPHDASDCSEDTLEFLRKLSQSPKVHAWGEIGLDFNRMYSPQKDQEKWFVRQMEMADELKLPMIFHERDSKGRFLEMLKAHFKNGIKGVVHCFSGNKAEMEQYLELGLCIGITGILTIQKRGAALRKLVPFIPEDRLLIETDAPYLTPAPQKNRVRRNEPAFVKSVLLKLAEVRDEDAENLAAILWKNTCRVFNIREHLS